MVRSETGTGTESQQSKSLHRRGVTRSQSPFRNSAAESSGVSRCVGSRIAGGTATAVALCVPTTGRGHRVSPSQSTFSRTRQHSATTKRVRNVWGRSAEWIILQCVGRGPRLARSRPCRITHEIPFCFRLDSFNPQPEARTADPRLRLRLKRTVHFASVVTNNLQRILPARKTMAGADSSVVSGEGPIFLRRSNR
jgi:hypothetical protein